MKTILLFILSIIPPTLIALTLGSSPCLEKWPKNTPSGKIEMTYEISKTCEPTKVNFIVSKPKGAFNDYAMCQIKRLSHYWYWGHSKSKETMTEKEYKKLIKEEPKPPPDKHHAKKIHAVDNNGETVTLACYFTKEGVLSSHALDNGKTEKEVNTDYLNKLPEQSYKVEFKTKL